MSALPALQIAPDRWRLVDRLPARPRFTFTPIVEGRCRLCPTPVPAVHWDAQERAYCGDHWLLESTRSRLVTQRVPRALLANVVAQEFPCGYRGHAAPEQTALLGVLLLFSPEPLSGTDLACALWGPRFLAAGSFMTRYRYWDYQHNVAMLAHRLRRALPPGYRMECGRGWAFYRLLREEALP